jgi:PIN domain nuclease of toxin-antitoxin system
MRYLLDTHTFLWTIAGTGNLSEKARAIVEDETNEIIVSAVSLWEITVKIRINKLDLGKIKPEKLLDLIRKMDFSTIELSAAEAVSYYKLNESTHNDPFDRMLIWQAITRNLIIISKDCDFDKFKPFGLKLAW